MCDEPVDDESEVGHQVLDIEKMPQWIPELAQDEIRRDVEFSLFEENVFVSRHRDAIVEAYGKDRTFRFLLIPRDWSEIRFNRVSAAELEEQGFPVKAMRSVLRLGSFAPSKILLFGERSKGRGQMGRR